MDQTCYRHPEVETGIRCTRCERPICPECMVSASVGFQCPECVRDGSGTGHAPTANQPRTVAGSAVTKGDPRLLTKLLIGANVLVFIAVMAQGNRLVSDLAMLGGWPLPPRFVTEGVAAGQWYRLVTSMFLHQEVWHIGFNMLSLWWLGGPLEAQLGRLRFLALYLLSGLAGSACVYLFADPNSFTLGASGAVFGLFGATAVLMRRMRYDMRPLIAILAVNLLITFMTPGISWQAHIGGLVAGGAMAFGILLPAPREKRALVQAGTFAVTAVVILVVVLARTAALT
ncbi:rhomboid family intramembrane serine protease [Streptomyces sp. NPDC001941]|uniref:rhomboid family intramembrane serine protease n=1 Tax=Streptomyces sp. NPDC001941 TaxID=3154659 RepID=UPI00331A2116